MSLPLFSFAALSGVLWLTWRLLHPYLVRSNLDNVPGPTPESFLMGDMTPLFDRHRGWDYKAKLTEAYGSVVRVQGILGARILYVFDPVALQHMFAKEGTVYEFSEWLYAVDNITFGPGLLSVGGSQHRRQRKMLNPIFSTDNIRNMTPLFYDISRKLRDSIATLVGNTSREVDVVHWFSRAALEHVAQGGMGTSFDPLTPDVQEPHPMAEAIKNVVPVSFELNLWRLLAGHLQKLGPPQFRRQLVNLLVLLQLNKNFRRLRDIIDTIDNISRTIFYEKKGALIKGNDEQPQATRGKQDIMSILLKANLRSREEDRLSDKELIGQISTLLFGGTDTTSGVLGRIFHLLAAHPDVQEKLREEIAEARDYPGQDIPYDQLSALPLLEAVCRETLRLYSPVNLLPREAVTDVVMPLHKPILGRDGTLIHQLPIPKGTLIVPSYISCNTNKDIWGEDALEWKPERWLSPLPSTLTDVRIPGVYASLMSFGGGGRSCIGFRFAQIEIKIILSLLLESFKFSLTNQAVYWNWSSIIYPTMSKENNEQSLVLRIEAIPPEAK